MLVQLKTLGCRLNQFELLFLHELFYPLRNALVIQRIVQLFALCSTGHVPCHFQINTDNLLHLPLPIPQTDNRLEAQIFNNYDIHQVSLYKARPDSGSNHDLKFVQVPSRSGHNFAR